MISRRQLVVVTAASAFIGQRASAASGFPAHDITFIVPWGAGGSNDILARELQPLLREQGVNIVIENQVGATGAIGLRRVATSEPDGYTLGMGTSSTLAYIAQGKTPLRNSQFTPIARASTDPLLLLVPGSGPVTTLAQFIAFAKTHPGSLSIGTPGTYNLNHIFAAMTARAAGVTYINRRTVTLADAKVITDLAGGQIQAAVLKPSESLGQIQSRVSSARSAYSGTNGSLCFPNVPTFKERGFDVFPYGPVVQMAYVVGPAKMPEPTLYVTSLIEVFRKAPFRTLASRSSRRRNSFVVDDLTGDALTKEVDQVIEQSVKTVASKVF